MSSGATIGTVDTAGTFAESCGVFIMTASADTTGIWENISTIGAVTSVDSPTLSNEYVYGSYVDEPLALINSGGTYFYADNRVYSPAAMTDVWGAVVERYRYDSYGNRTVMLADDSAPKTSMFVGNQRGFTGYYADAESGLYYARARMYSPALGRFLSRDMFGDKGLLIHPISDPPNNRVVDLQRDAWQTIGGNIDGMNLYAAYFVPNSVDSRGLETKPIHFSFDMGVGKYSVEVNPWDGKFVWSCVEGHEESHIDSLPGWSGPTGVGGAVFGVTIGLYVDIQQSNNSLWQTCKDAKVNAGQQYHVDMWVYAVKHLGLIISTSDVVGYDHLKRDCPCKCPAATGTPASSPQIAP
jgi:RHS repeat-associated protein